MRHRFRPSLAPLHHTRPAGRWAWVLALVTVATAAQAETGLTEVDFFEPVPVVLTATRLAQPLSDTPGAVTVIDRDTIQRSGARDVVELLRWVPGYMVSGYNGANPNAAYHAPLDDFGMRNLVMVDGRSVYSSFYLGGTHRGLMGILLEDIERLEVVRGSNSSVYGANAMFGVINVVTRHSADTVGTQLGLALGQADVADAYARIGWGTPDASYRLSAGRRADSGYVGADDDRVLDQLHFRADVQAGAGREVQLHLGHVQHQFQDGFAGGVNNPLRDVRWVENYLNLRWKRFLADDESLELSATLDDESVVDATPFPPQPALLLDYGGVGRRYNLELQHQRALSDRTRMVWGLGWKRDQARSSALYGQDNWVSNDEYRVYGNLESRLSPHWLLNAGLMLAEHQHSGGYAAPRLALNWQPTADHALKLGVSRSVRTPTLYETSADVRYYLAGVQIGRTTLATGAAEPETLATQEVSYYGRWPAQQLTLDARWFREHMRDTIEAQRYQVLPSLPTTGTVAQDYVNTPGLTLHGLEYQARWSPLPDTQFWWSQSWLDYRWWDPTLTGHVPPQQSASLTWFQRLPHQWDMTLAWHYQGAMNWRGRLNQLPATHRVDLRLSRPVRWAQGKGEVALTVQNLNGSQPVFSPNFWLDRRAILTLKLEM